MSATAETIARPRRPSRWRRRLLRSLLYGRNGDRAAKARARVGLAIIAFAVVYGVIAVRLVMFAAVSDSHVAHRVVSGDAIATARPDILDRNGEVLATDVRVPSLYAEPRRLIDVDEAVELLTADLPDLDATELRERLSSRRGFVWLKRDITPEQQREIYHPGPARHRLPQREQARSIRTAPRSRICSATSISTIRASPASRNGSTTRASPRCTWRGSPPTGCRRRCSSPSICACSMRCATSWSKRATNSRPSPPPASCSTSAPARSSPWCRSRITTRTIRTRRSIRPASTASPPASTRWARPSRRSPSPWRSIPAR